MIIAVSSEGKDKNNLLDIRFGRCEYFQIFNIENGESKVVENKGAASSGGAGIVAAQQIVDENVDVVITGNVGPNAFDVLKPSEIKVFKCEPTEVNKAIELYKNNKLDEINASGPSHMGMKSTDVR